VTGIHAICAAFSVHRVTVFRWQKRGFPVHMVANTPVVVMAEALAWMRVQDTLREARAKKVQDAAWDRVRGLTPAGAGDTAG
jgi:hypothetical protein